MNMTCQGENLSERCDVLDDAFALGVEVPRQALQIGHVPFCDAG
jgi:hypothetical protein